MIVFKITFTGEDFKVVLHLQEAEDVSNLEAHLRKVIPESRKFTVEVEIINVLSHIEVMVQLFDIWKLFYPKQFPNDPEPV